MAPVDVVALPRLSEHEAEVEEEVYFLGVVAIANGGTDGAQGSPESIGKLETEHGGVVENVVEFTGMLGCGSTQGDVVLALNALLGLQLDGEKIGVDVFHVPYADEGHLLFHIMAKPLSANHVAQIDGPLVSDEHTAIDRRLEGEMTRHRNIDSP